MVVVEVIPLFYHKWKYIGCTNQMYWLEHQDVVSTQQNHHAKWLKKPLISWLISKNFILLICQRNFTVDLQHSTTHQN